MDYMILKLIWWGIFCFIVIAFAVTGGMDIGVNLLLPILGRNDDERRLVLNSVGPTWEGNQVWLITLGAGLFAIWPIAYATIFSSMYFAFMLVLVMLILRPPGFDYRGKINSHVWRRTWDLSLFTSSIVLALSFGVVLGNFFTGLSFYFDKDFHPIYNGSFIDLFSPCALMFGITTLCILGLQGALYLQYKLNGLIAKRAQKTTQILGIAFIISFIATGYYVALYVAGYQILSPRNYNASLIVTNKTVVPIQGWLINYANNKILWLFPILTLICVRLAMRLSSREYPLKALLLNSMGIEFAILTAATALFPFIMPSTGNPNHSLTIWDVSSSELTLKWSLLALIILLPIILLYTTWVYRVMRGKVKLSAESY